MAQKQQQVKGTPAFELAKAKYMRTWGALEVAVRNWPSNALQESAGCSFFLHDFAGDLCLGKAWTEKSAEASDEDAKTRLNRRGGFLPVGCYELKFFPGNASYSRAGLAWVWAGASKAEIDTEWKSWRQKEEKLEEIDLRSSRTARLLHRKYDRGEIKPYSTESRALRRAEAIAAAEGRDLGWKPIPPEREKEHGDCWFVARLFNPRWDQRYIRICRADESLEVIAGLAASVETDGIYSLKSCTFIVGTFPPFRRQQAEAWLFSDLTQHMEDAHYHIGKNPQLHSGKAGLVPRFDEEPKAEVVRTVLKFPGGLSYTVCAKEGESFVSLLKTTQ